MSSRNLLHAADAPAFIEWAKGWGWTVDPLNPANPYEVFRLRDPKGRTHVGYKRFRTDHVTVTGDAIIGAIWRFLDQKRRQRRIEGAS